MRPACGSGGACFRYQDQRPSALGEQVGGRLDRRTRRYHKTAAWLIWVTAYARLGQTRLKNAEVTQFYRHISGQAVGDLIERALDNVENLMLHHSSLVTDRYYNVTLGQFRPGSIY